ncbi:helix-turn-helix transcriptional regulator [Corynebacterium lubricantis]|uniref:helix-turn-helix transcriptional regulator n=1 Tax=Corynebacterium lubricantis TaxID=541095 RepID=UPI0003722423|nr:MarR family transcriptional regulator [Corynebacterium lubricantis]
MTQQSVPRPATELFPESLRLSPKQAEVLSTLQEFDNGARASDVAAELGMHVNTARGHLDELVLKGAVQVTTAPAEGRGRPSLVFHVRVPDNQTIADEYINLIEVLVSLLDEGTQASDDAGHSSRQLSEKSFEQAQAIGKKWAQKMGSSDHEWDSVSDALPLLFHRLRDMGFDPAVESDTKKDSAELSLNACPFVSEPGKKPSAFVCAVHSGFLQETAQGSSTGSHRVNVKLLPFKNAQQCAVEVNQLKGQ